MLNINKKVLYISPDGMLEPLGDSQVLKYLEKLSAQFLGRGGAWLDTGSIEDYYKTSAFVQAIENRQGLKIACLEEIALLNKWISKSQIMKQVKFYGNCEYSNYLKKIIKKSA